MAAPARAATSVAIATVRCSYSSIAWRSYTVASVKIVPWRLAVEDYAHTRYVAYCCMFIMIFIDHFLAYIRNIGGSATLIRLRISLQVYVHTQQTLHQVEYVFTCMFKLVCFSTSLNGRKGKEINGLIWACCNVIPLTRLMPWFQALPIVSKLCLHT